MIMATDAQILTELQMSLELLQNIDKDAFVAAIGPKRQGIEQAIFDKEVSKEDQLKLIADYSALIEMYYAKNDHESSSDNDLAKLITACFTVGYVMGLGKECAPLLPVLALSGANIEKGMQIMKAFKESHSQPKLKS